MKNYCVVVAAVLLCGILGSGCDQIASTSYDIHRIAHDAHGNYTPLIEVAIIGSGPAGLSAALYVGRAGMAPVVFTGLKPAGALGDTTEVENWPGMPHVQGPEAIDILKEQATEFGAIFSSQTIEKIDVSSWPFVITTEAGEKLYALSIIIATGASPVRTKIPGEATYWGKGVTNCAICDAPYHKGTDVVVIGGGDSAAEEAMQLARYAQKVTVVVRRDHMRAAARMQERMALYPNITIAYNSEVTEIKGDTFKVTGATVYNNVTKESTSIDITGVFLAIGHTPNTDLCKGQIALTPSGHIKMEGRTQATSVAGVFAAGDVEDNRYRQAGTSAGRGIGAGLDAISFLEEHGYTPENGALLRNSLYKPSTVKRAKLTQLSDQEEFEERLRNATGLVLVDFYTQSCPSCLHMMPAVEEIAAEYAGRVDVIKIDKDESKAIAEQLKVFNVPVIMIFKNGQLMARFNKVLSKAKLQELIEQFI
jgi:thioredoxin reductase (NADPH)